VTFLPQDAFTSFSLGKKKKIENIKTKMQMKKKNRKKNNTQSARLEQHTHKLIHLHVQHKVSHLWYPLAI
jgi:hypothetical protein